jgi:hypothetical protein
LAKARHFIISAQFSVEGKADEATAIERELTKRRSGNFEPQWLLLAWRSLLLCVGECDVGAEAEHAEAGGSALTAAEGGAGIQGHISRS